VPIERDLSGLPAATTTSQAGWAPDPQPRFGHILAEKWARERTEKAHAIEGSRFRHSDAGACSRAIAYAALKVPESNPIDLAGLFIAGQGTLIHDAWQAVLQARYGHNAEVEVKVGEGDESGHIDAVVQYQPWGTALIVVSIELKTVDGYAYKLAVGERGPAQGPKWQHMIQGALNASRVQADESVIVYLARGAISIQAAARKKIDELSRFVAEWTMPQETYEALAQRERTRIGKILEMVDSGTLPARKIPDPELPGRHLIVEPRTGGWVATDENGMTTDAGSCWQCAYCRYQDVCVQTKAERTPVDVLRQIGVLDAVAPPESGTEPYPDQD
jgi:hypothetical protein